MSNEPNPSQSRSDAASAGGDTPTPLEPTIDMVGLDAGSGLRPGVRPVPEYELVSRLGKGGFGEVWRARDAEAFEVALKFLRLDERTTESEMRALELMKNVRHAHLLPMFRLWRTGGWLVLALELADQTLYGRLVEAEMAGRSGIPRAELLTSMLDCAKGLDFLHEKGIQHRDVKPQNLLLVGGSVKVGDFGLAKLLERSLASNSGAMTPSYAAPEQIQGQVSLHSDQYALAVSYCQLRGGRLPFGGNPVQLMYGHLHGEPDLSMLPEAERPAVAKALAKKPEERYADCKSFVKVLGRISTRKPSILPAVLVTQTEIVINRERQPEDLGPPMAAAPFDAIKAKVIQEAWAKYLGRKVEEHVHLVSSLTMKLQLIPPGSFEMGAADGEQDARDDEKPRHAVTITKPFYLGTFEVTQAEYQAIAADAPSSFKEFAGENTGRFPVETVSWDDAQAFCVRLTADFRAAGGRGMFTLPTEAQWEYACRAGTTTPFHFGTVLNGLQANCDGNFPYGTAQKGNYLKRTCQVGSYPPNSWGLHDMHGSVWEWCQDWYQEDYYRLKENKDPYNPNGDSARVLRGGSWLSVSNLCRAAARSKNGPRDRYECHGFRVVLHLD